MTMLVAVAYHYIRDSFDSPYTSILGLTPDELSAQLDRLGRIAPFVSQPDVADAIAGRRKLPDRCWLLTFDDGLREQYDLAWTILERRGIPAVFFVNTEPIFEGKTSTVHKLHILRSQVSPEVLLAVVKEQLESSGLRPLVSQGSNPYRFDDPAGAELKYLLNLALPHAQAAAVVDAAMATLMGSRAGDIGAELYMTPDQLSRLAAADCVGTHGHSHVALGRLPVDEAAHQIRRSCELLRHHTGTAPVAMSYPYGSIDACSVAVAERASAAGIKFAFTTEPAANSSFDLPLLLARIDCNDAPGGRHAPDHAEQAFERLPLASWYRHVPPTQPARIV